LSKINSFSEESNEPIKKTRRLIKIRGLCFYVADVPENITDQMLKSAILRMLKFSGIAG